MKQPKKLTRRQKEFLSKKGLNPENWMVQKETNESIVFIHKTSKSTRKFEKPI